MAKKKKYPKKPKSTASVQTIERYFEKRKEVDKHNAKVESDKKKKKTLLEKLHRI